MRRQLNRPASRKLRSVSPAQRRAVIRAVNSAQPLTEEQRGVAEAQREQLRSSAARLAWALPFAVLGSVMIAIRDYGGMRPLWVAMAIVELLCAVSAVLLFRRQSRRIEKALDASRSST